MLQLVLLVLRLHWVATLPLHHPTCAATTPQVDNFCKLNSGILTQLLDQATLVRRMIDIFLMFVLIYIIGTVHGLWPDNCDGTYQQFCDTSRQSTDITGVLTKFGKTELLSYMQIYWKDYQGNDETFWEHEWNKHGTCISTFDSTCYPNYQTNQEIPDFFQKTVDLFKTLNTYEVLCICAPIHFKRLLIFHTDPSCCWYHSFWQQHLHPSCHPSCHHQGSWPARYRQLQGRRIQRSLVSVQRMS